MNDVATWRPGGRVHTLRIEVADWSVEDELWRRPRLLGTVEFRPDGQLSESVRYYGGGVVSNTTYLYDGSGRLAETHSRVIDGQANKIVRFYDGVGRLERAVRVDGAETQREVERCRYDSVGRKVKVQLIHGQHLNMLYPIEGSEQAIAAPGAVSLTTMYNERDQPTEALLHDAGHEIVRRIVFTRDDNGTVLKEEVFYGGQTPFPTSHQERASSLNDLLRETAFPGQTFSTTTFAYDPNGHLAERVRRIGRVSEERDTFRYDDRGNPIEQRKTTRHLDLELVDASSPPAAPPPSLEEGYRFEYRYDEQGNWTERVTSARGPSNSGFQRVTLEYRKIVYYSD